MSAPSSLDPETRKVFSSAEHIQSMLKSDGWKIAKEKLDVIILDLQNINNLDLEKMDTLSTQLVGRKMAAEALYGWLKDLYGTVEQMEAANVPQVESTSYIGRHDS